LLNEENKKLLQGQTQTTVPYSKKYVLRRHEEPHEAKIEVKTTK